MNKARPDEHPPRREGIVLNRRHQMPKGLLVAAVLVAIVSMPAHVAAASTPVPCPNTFHSPSGTADGFTDR